MVRLLLFISVSQGVVLITLKPSPPLAIAFFAEAITKFHGIPGFFLHLFKSVTPAGTEAKLQPVTVTTTGKSRTRRTLVPDTSSPQYDLIAILKQ